MHKPLIIAHRGASELAPENTLAAFEKAIEDEAEGIEFDIQLSKDSVPMVFHDEDLKRIAEMDELVAELNSKELQNLDVGTWFNKLNPEKAQQRFVDERISTLEQTLDFLKDYKGLVYVELKGEKTKDIRMFAKSVCDVIKHSNLLPQLIVKSFNLDLLPLIKKYCPNVKTAALFSPTIMILLRKEKRLINIAKDVWADSLSLHFSLATRKLMKKSEKKNLNVAIWTVDNPRWVKRGIKLGISHIITNNPARLLEKRDDILFKKSILT